MKPGTNTIEGDGEDDTELLIEEETVDFLMGLVVVVSVCDLSSCLDNPS